ncbi:MAG TPA: monovalent cation/H(+) antiporter subunit G [Stellaceae bacterium]|nr:monovalent cation/H(+) antiporter subunit G [Stellaceae bacterium]
MIDILLSAAVVCTWLGALGFTRLQHSLDRLHVAGYLSATLAATLLPAAAIEDGLSNRVLKLLLISALVLGLGAGTSHVIARAIGRHDPKMLEPPS